MAPYITATLKVLFDFSALCTVMKNKALKAAVY